MIRRTISLGLTIILTWTSVAPAQMLPLASSSPMAVSIFSPLLRGLTIHPDQPLSIDFVIDMGDGNNPSNPELKDISLTFIKYFLAALAVPEKDVWVNLSPQEPDRIIQNNLGVTQLGQDLLMQDYLLKQLTASLLSPENETGKKFWERVYEKLYKDLSSPNVSIGDPSSEQNGFPIEAFENDSFEDAIESFNRVWIVPKSAKIYQKGNSVFVTDAEMDVMLEGDYLAVQHNNKLSSQRTLGSILKSDVTTENNGSSIGVEDDSFVVKKMIQDTILPIIKDEINHGETFAQLRQIYHALILAGWYKNTLKQSLLSRSFVDKGQTRGISSDDPQAIENIYQKYLDAFQSSLEGMIKDDYDPQTQSVTPRKYVTGGYDNAKLTERIVPAVEKDLALLTGHPAVVTVDLVDSAQMSQPVPEEASAEILEQFQVWLSQRSNDPEKFYEVWMRMEKILRIMIGYEEGPYEFINTKSLNMEELSFYQELGGFIRHQWRQRNWDKFFPINSNMALIYSGFVSDVNVFWAATEKVSALTNSDDPWERLDALMIQALSVYLHIQLISPHPEDNQRGEPTLFDNDLLVKLVREALPLMLRLSHDDKWNEVIPFIWEEHQTDVTYGQMYSVTLFRVLAPLIHNYFYASGFAKDRINLKEGMLKKWGTGFEIMTSYMMLMLTDLKDENGVVNQKDVDHFLASIFEMVLYRRYSSLLMDPDQFQLQSRDLRKIREKLGGTFFFSVPGMESMVLPFVFQPIPKIYSEPEFGFEDVVANRSNGGLSEYYLFTQEPLKTLFPETAAVLEGFDQEANGLYKKDFEEHYLTDAAMMNRKLNETILSSHLKNNRELTKKEKLIWSKFVYDEEENLWFIDDGGLFDLFFKTAKLDRRYYRDTVIQTMKGLGFDYAGRIVFDEIQEGLADSGFRTVIIPHEREYFSYRLFENGVLPERLFSEDWIRLAFKGIMGRNLEFFPLDMTKRVQKFVARAIAAQWYHQSEVTDFNILIDQMIWNDIDKEALKQDQDLIYALKHFVSPIFLTVEDKDGKILIRTQWKKLEENEITPSLFREWFNKWWEGSKGDNNNFAMMSLASEAAVVLVSIIGAMQSRISDLRKTGGIDMASAWSKTQVQNDDSALTAAFSNLSDPSDVLTGLNPVIRHISFPASFSAYAASLP